MKLHSITLRVIKAPLKNPFITHLETVTEREVIIVEARDKEGLVGYGEAVPFSSPWYTEETVKTCFHMLEDFLIPLTFHSTWDHPLELSTIWSGVRRNHMAKAALEQAILDLYAKQKDVYIGTLFGGKREFVAAGVVVAAKNVDESLRQIEQFQKQHYQRYKIKVHPENDFLFLSEIRRIYPKLPLMADANSAYSLQNMAKLKRLDELNLQMIEQPLGAWDLIDHAQLQRELETPICLDESISSFHDASTALMLQSCQILTVKMARVGGWSQAKKIHDLCMSKGIPLWCGGMIEFGISKAHNIALATLPGFTIPGDIASSSRYWDEDIVEPEIEVVNGVVSVPKAAGIGYKINEKRIEELTQYREQFHDV